MHAIAGCFQYRAQKGANRAFAVGARHMNDRRKFLLWIAEFF